MSATPFLLCLCLSLGPRAPQARPDRWIAEDKLRHFFVTFAVTSLAGSTARLAGLEPRPAAWTGAGVGLALGVAKELRDLARPGSDASLRDLLWDAGGAAASAALLREAR